MSKDENIKHDISEKIEKWISNLIIFLEMLLNSIFDWIDVRRGLFNKKEGLHKMRDIMNDPHTI